jgi:hypothetical protein
MENALRKKQKMLVCAAGWEGRASCSIGGAAATGH